MLASSLGGRGAYVQCKHVYHVLQMIMFMGSWKISFIIAHGVGMKFNVC